MRGWHALGLVLGALAACGCALLLINGAEFGGRPSVSALPCGCGVVPTTTPWTGAAAGANARFFRVADEAPACALESSVDRLLRPTIEARFGGTKLQSCGSCSGTPIACTSYVVERVFGAVDGEGLFRALVASGATGTREPEPSHGRNAVEFAVAPRAESLAVTISLTLDLDLQVIEVSVR